ncbi:hypothetical protein AOA60_20610 [Pseudomonas sp. 2822-17]|nr:hypothetical protein AOA60_20610 [Pseudomonas sp. 2822-17]
MYGEELLHLVLTAVVFLYIYINKVEKNFLDLFQTYGMLPPLFLHQKEVTSFSLKHIKKAHHMQEFI